MPVIHSNRWDSQKRRLANLAEVNDTPGDMCELHTSATPKDASVILPAILAGLVAVAVIAGVKFRIWEAIQGVWQ